MARCSARAAKGPLLSFFIEHRINIPAGSDLYADDLLTPECPAPMKSTGLFKATAPTCTRVIPKSRDFIEA